MAKVKGEGIGETPNQELAKIQLAEDVAQGNVGMFFDHAADAQVPREVLKSLLIEALNNRASNWDTAAGKIGASVGFRGLWGENLTFGGNDFEKKRAENLRKLAKLIKDL